MPSMTQSREIRSRWGLGVRAIVTLAFAFATLAPSAWAVDDEQMYEGILYACTGIAESKTDPRWEQYAVKMVFAGATGQLLGDIQVRVDDKNGRQIFETHCFAPWLMLALQPGRYKATATARQVFTHSVDFLVSAGRQAYIVVRFPEINDL